MGGWGEASLLSSIVVFSAVKDMAGPAAPIVSDVSLGGMG